MFRFIIIIVMTLDLSHFAIWRVEKCKLW